MPEANNTEQSFIQQIQRLFTAEKMLTQAIPKMMAKAKSPGLQKSLAHHLAETHQHKEALRLICKNFNVDADASSNDDMKAITDEGEKAMNAASEDIDTAIITSAKKVEEYEIAQYETVSNAAKSLGYDGIAARLRLTQEEEYQALTKLSFIEKEIPYQKAQVISI